MFKETMAFQHGFILTHIDGMRSSACFLEITIKDFIQEVFQLIGILPILNRVLVQDSQSQILICIYLFHIGNDIIKIRKVMTIDKCFRIEIQRNIRISIIDRNRIRPECIYDLLGQIALV
jgi:hypothetical protein